MHEPSACSRLSPWPCVAVAAARAGVADRGSLQRLGPPEVSASHSTLCHGPPCICAESGGNPPYPAGEGGGRKKGINVKGNTVREGGRIGDISFFIFLLNEMSAFKDIILHCGFIHVSASWPVSSTSVTSS